MSRAAVHMLAWSFWCIPWSAFSGPQGLHTFLFPPWEIILLVFSQLIEASSLLSGIRFCFSLIALLGAVAVTLARRVMLCHGAGQCFLPACLENSDWPAAAMWVKGCQLPFLGKDCPTLRGVSSCPLLS